VSERDLELVAHAKRGPAAAAHLSFDLRRYRLARRPLAHREIEHEHGRAFVVFDVSCSRLLCRELELECRDMTVVGRSDAEKTSVHSELGDAPRWSVMYR